MTTYTLSATYILRDPTDYSYVETNPSVIQLIVDDTATTFSYDITFDNFGFIPLVEFSTADTSGTDLGSFTVLIDGTNYLSTDLNLFFGQLEWGTGNISYIVDLMFTADTDYATHYIFQLGGDPIGLGTDLTIAEMQALEATFTDNGPITSGTFAVGADIPFSALTYLIDPDPNTNIINGTTADDVYDGGSGADYVSGGAGDDDISGGTGNDLLMGNEGDDFLYGNTGADSIYGGTGNDNILGGAGSDLISGGEGDDTVLAGTSNDTIDGGHGNDILSGQSGDDIINGDAGDDLILGGNGNDTIDGGADNDTILGGRGNDIISGGLGDDVMTGGTGADSFVFLATDGGIDRITDFNVALDTLDLSGYLTAHTEAVMTMTDTGNGVLIDFGNGDTIQLDNVASISDLDLGLIL